MNRLLLQGARRKGKRGLADPLPLLYIRNGEGRSLQCPGDLSTSRSIIRYLFPGSGTIILCGQSLTGPLLRQVSLDGPVLLRNELRDLRLPVRDKPKRYGLNAPRTQASFNLGPKQRADPIADHPVKNPSCLLRVDHIHIDRTRVLQRLLHRIFRNLIECDPECLLRIQMKRRHQVPADRLPFAVRVSCEKNLIRLFAFLPELGENLSLPADRDILRFIVILHIKAELALGQIPDMAGRSHDLIL